MLRAGRELSAKVALQTAPETPRDEITIRSRSPFSGAKVANLSPALADELQLQNADEGVVIVDVDNGSYASNLGFQRGDVIVSVNGEQHRQDPRPRTRHRAAEPLLAHRHPPRRAADFRGVQRMTPRAKAAVQPCSPPPASTRTRRARSPTSCARPKLDEVVGQDHLLGPDGALTRMLATRSLGSLVFWGPPGTGKTTVARLLAQATDLHFEQISAIFTGVADLKKVFEEARRRRETGAGHAAVRRRDPSLQPRPAGQLPAGDGGRHHRAGRRHHREPVVRTERAAAVARARAGVQIARRGGDREAAGARRSRSRARKLPLDDDARAHAHRAWPTATAAPRSRWPRKSGAPPARTKSSMPRKLQEIVQRRAPIYDKAQDGHYNLISRAAQVGARLRSRRRALLSLPHARCRRAAALHRAPRGAHGDRGHRARRSAGAGDRQCRQGRLRFPGLARKANSRSRRR